MAASTKPRSIRRTDSRGAVSSDRSAEGKAQRKRTEVSGPARSSEATPRLTPTQRGARLRGMKKSALEAEFDLIWKQVVSESADPKALSLVSEHPFARSVGRKFRFDRCSLDKRVAVEIQGGTWTGGRHTSPQGYRKDCEKLLIAAELHWQIIYLTSDMLTLTNLRRIAGIINSRQRIEGADHDWLICNTIENKQEGN